MSDDITHNGMKFRDAIGQKATIQRTTMGGSAASTPNRLLCDLGLSVHPLPNTETKYFGSAAVHIFGHEELKQLFFISQVQPLLLYRCPEPLAAKGFDDLLNTMKEFYGHRRPKLRSGF